jgi:hypothetical protein
MTRAGAQVVDPLRIRTSYSETDARLLETGTPSAVDPLRFTNPDETTTAPKG